MPAAGGAASLRACPPPPLTCCLTILRTPPQIVHCDIKPCNILVCVDANGEPMAKLVDFSGGEWGVGRSSPAHGQPGPVACSPSAHSVQPQPACFLPCRLGLSGCTVNPLHER